MNARDRTRWLRPSPPIAVDDEPPEAATPEPPGDAEPASGDSGEERQTEEKLTR